MKIVFSLPEPKGELEGAPFAIILKGRSKVQIRKVLLVTGFAWILYSLTGQVQYKGDHVIFSLLLIIAFLIAQDKAVGIMGNHGNWEVSSFRYSELGGLVMRVLKVENFTCEFRITSRKKNHAAYIMIQDLETEEELISILTPNKLAKEFKDTLEIINIPITLRKRGKMKTPPTKGE
ncbi:MAG: hypothetical protein ACXAD7_12180 [Candidatus Kariarchaeaceae archaeon]